MERGARGRLSEIPREILSDKFHELIGGRRLRAAVFLTFRFDPGFFEQEVLPAFLDIPMSHVPEIRLLNLEDALRQVDGVAVYYDRRGLVAGAMSGKLDVQRIAVLPASDFHGYFHPKNVMALVDDEPEGDEKPSQTLIVAAMSANLTRAGWWENVEVVHIEEVHESEPCSFRDDLLTLIRIVRRSAPHVERHDALDRIQEFVRGITPEEQRTRGNVILPRLFAHESVIDFLADDVRLRNRVQGCNLEILSPYFDDSKSSAGPIEQLRSTFRPREIRVFLPRGLENEALCSSAYYDQVAAVADWGSLPKEVMRLSKSNERTLHAKSYRFFNRERGYEAFFVGSVNLTSAAFNRGGNVETGFFIETDSPSRGTLDWWLTANASPPGTFAPRDEAEGLAEGAGWKLSLRFDWSSERGDVYWDDSRSSRRLQLFAQGAHIGTLDPLPPRHRVELSSDVNSLLLDALRSSSFITVRIEGEGEAQILVEETRMTHKPSLMKTLTADDILRYWSLLTAEQKKEFLEDHAGDLVNDPELAYRLSSMRAPSDADAFFTTFAQIYLSFGNVERAVRIALEQGREREAIDRLFGKKFDSVWQLIDRVTKEPDADPVRHYVTTLCARQLLDALSADVSDFMARNREDVIRLRKMIENAAKIRERLHFGTASEQSMFFQWFERWFLRRAQVMQLEAE